MTRPPAPPHASPGLIRQTWRRYLRSKTGVLGLAVVALLIAIAFLSPILANSQPIAARFQGKWYFPGVVESLQNIPIAGRWIRKDVPFRLATFDFKQEYRPDRDWALWAPVPYGPLEIAADPYRPNSRTHLLGTDEVGRDVLARMIYGTSVSIQVGFISMGLAAVIGIVIGALAGYFGGWIDIAISRFIEVVMCFPTIFLILAILAWYPPDIKNVMVVIGLTSWTGIARYARGEYLRLRSVDYAQAARALGAGPGRIIFRHLLPNSLAPVMVSVTFGIASAILVESALSWLGFGVQPPQPSWGNILRSGYDNLFTAPFLIPAPCIAIFVAVLAFNLVGDTLRDVIDPRTSESSH
jgi:peptide/nickel transport system permease protein